MLTQFIRTLAISTVILCTLATSASAQVTQEPSTPEPAQAEPAHLMGKWICNNNPEDVYVINPDKTILHFRDKGSWQVAENLLTITWGNGFRLTFDTTQKGPSITGNSYPPGADKPDILKFSRPQESPPAATPGFSQESTPAVNTAATTATVTLPAERTLTSADGRQMAGTVMSKEATKIKFRRASDAKEFDIPLDKLSPDDRAWVASTTNPAVKLLLVTTMREGTILLKEIKQYAENRDITMTIGDLDMFKPETLRQYDLVWYELCDYDDRKAENYKPIEARFNILKAHPGIVIFPCMGEASSRNQALRVKDWNEHAKKPYVRADGNFIIFNTWTHEKGLFVVNA